MLFQPLAWRQIIGASLMAVCAAWLIFAIVASYDVLSRPSSDIAMALYPAAMAGAFVVAVLLFWPLNIVLARIGTNLALTHIWARLWWTWAMIGAVIGAIAFALFLGAISSWSAELGLSAAMGAAIGGVAALVTHWRLGLGRLA